MEMAVIYLLVVAINSIWAFLAFGIDKRRAQSGRRRISEKSLHLIAFAGGWPGALAAQHVFRHKTQKASFRFIFWTVTILHLGLVLGAIFYLQRPA